MFSWRELIGRLAPHIGETQAALAVRGQYEDVVKSLAQILPPPLRESWLIDALGAVEDSSVPAAELGHIEESQQGFFKAPLCVCGHPLFQHAYRGSVLACTVEGCACGPACIHSGFVPADE